MTSRSSESDGPGPPRKTQGPTARRLAVVLFAFTVLASAAGADPRDRKPHEVLVEGDLDGDGVAESIRVAFDYSSMNRFVVRVGAASLDGVGEGLRGEAFVVDVDSSDGWREIAIPEWGPSDDDACEFFRFESGRLRRFGAVPGIYAQELIIDGSGTIRTTCRGRTLHTWFYSCGFVESPESRTLVEVRQQFKTMNTKVKLLHELPVYETPDARQDLRMLPAGQALVIELTDDTCDQSAWYRVRSATGQVGWFTLRGGRVWPTALRPDEIMDGLTFAD